MAKHTFISILFILFFFILIIHKTSLYVYQKIPKKIHGPFEFICGTLELFFYDFMYIWFVNFHCEMQN